MTIIDSKTSHRQNNQPKLAVVGCGAIAETFYLPALAAIGLHATNLVLVDQDVRRAGKVGQRYGITNIAGDYRQVMDSVQGAIVAVPHHLHYSIAADLLSKGIHVLCEKPLTENLEQAKKLNTLAKEHNAALGVNMTRRLMSSSRKVKELLGSGALGKLRSLMYYDGAEFNWPTASGFYFDYHLSRKGVLLDIGAHVLDLVCWWLGAKPSVVMSENDSFGGCEAVSSLQLVHDGCTIDVRLSRLAKLPNRYVITGDEGTIEGMVYRGNMIALTTEKVSQSLSLGQPSEGMSDYGRTLVENFIDVVAGKTHPIIGGEEVLNSIALVEEAYAKARRFSMPWYGLKEGVHEYQ